MFVWSALLKSVGAWISNKDHPNHADACTKCCQREKSIEKEHIWYRISRTAAATHVFNQLICAYCCLVIYCGHLNTPQNMFLHMLRVSLLKACSIDTVKWRKCDYQGKRLGKNLWVEVVPANRSERSQNSLSRRCVNCGCQSQHHKLTKTCGVYLGGGQITETCKHLVSKP